MREKFAKTEHMKKRLFQIVEVGYTQDRVSRLYDIVNVAAIIINLVVSILYTFAPVEERYGGAIVVIEGVTVMFFTVDYILRVYTARYLREDGPEWKAILRYVFSFTGIVDLLSFLPYYLPFFFPEGAIAFRMFRVVRIFRLFRINAYYDSLNVITEVIVSKKQQLLSSVFIVVILMVASSLCMYSLEHEAQPDVFENAFSGIWWATSTLMTVGYGDIYPVTTAGQMLGIIITLIGAGMIAIPTGIISAGFVEQYAKIQKTAEIASEMDVSFIKVRLGHEDKWSGRSIKELGLPSGMVVAAVRRDDIIIVPSQDTVLMSGDSLVVAAEGHKENVDIDLKSIILKGQHPYIGRRVRDLDISRQTYIVMIKREGRIITPRGDSRLEEGDELVLYTRKFIPEATTISV